MITWPVTIRSVAPATPTTAGMPYSRAMTAPWAMLPPVCITSPPAVRNSGVQPGSVEGATSTSPGSSRAPVGSRITRARAVTVPGDAEFFEEGLAIAVGDLGLCSEKAKSEFIVAPLLIELRRALGRRFSVFSGMELNVNRARGLNGACDHVLTKGGNQHLRGAPIVGILKAKNEDHSLQGLGQCVAAMYAAQLRNRRDGWAVPFVFGAVTTGRAWQFLRLEGLALTVDQTRHHVQDLGRVMGALKSLIEGASAPAGSALAASTG